MLRNLAKLALGLGVVLGTSHAVASVPILTFQEQTTRPPAANPPDIAFSANPTPTFHAGPGSSGNGDGALLSAGVGPGLTINTPVTILPGTLGEQNNADGSTTFYDVSLVFTGLAPDAPAVQIGGPGGVDFQSLGAGTFAFYSSKIGGGLGTLLLSGTLANTATNGLDQTPTGAHFTLVDNSVAYTGGLIYNKLPSVDRTGSESISLLNITPTITINAGTHFLNDFTADATGLFSVNAIPEPACGGIMAVAGVLCTLRRRKSRS